MKIEVLGCHGSETPSAKTVGFLVEDRILLEAGTVSSVLSLDRQLAIHSVIISHLHLDHIKGLPFLADNLIGEPGSAITVYGIDEVLAGLKTHLFNDTIWPDCTRISNGDVSVLRFESLTKRATTRIGEVEVTPIPVNHTIPSIGLFLRKGDRTLLYTGDTAPTEEIWRIGRQMPDLSALLIEVSFPDAMEKIARVSGHMTPSMAARELEKLDRPEVPVYVFHMKPKYEAAIIAELQQLLGGAVEVLQEGAVLQI
ncbi:MAG: 3',5'-cyclic-nucleotide phosphodiesterase [Deltaproteobacteria bacterium]|nr:3',5'-cyclic-nucleotide phosphodiesterase [Deltaproteobacteria bacterium]